MFNEILTGQKSIEEKPAPIDTSPYRLPGELPPTLNCLRCQKSFPATQAIGGMCRTCAPNTDAVLASMRSNQRVSYVDQGEEERNRVVTGKVIAIAITLVIAIGLAFFRYNMRRQFREDMETSHAFDLDRSSSPYGR